MTAAFLAITITLLGLAATGLWFGVNRRRLEEIRIGIQALAKLKWRMCIGLVLEALQRDGYSEDAKLASANDESEFLLLRDRQKTLLSYKHGTAYRTSMADVREFASRLSLKGAARGLLITLGNADPDASAAAVRLDIEIIDGALLWAKLRSFLPEATRSEVAAQAMVQSRKGLWAGGLASIGAGLVVFIAGITLFSSGGTDTSTNANSSRQATTAASPHGQSVDMTSSQLDAARKALAEIASLTDADKARHRAEVAKQVSLMPQVRSAVWSAQSTLLLTLSQSDGKDEQLVEEACRILVGYEELRYSRLQLDPPSELKMPVRWHQCI